MTMRIEPMRFFPILAVAALALSGGCRTAYKEALAARQDVLLGTGEVAERRASEMAESTVNRRLGGFELARLKMLKRDIAGSSSLFAPRLDELFTEAHEGPVLKREQIAGNILAGTLADDRAIAYELPAFELIFGLQYQALNSLMLGNSDNARVYLKRATAVQQQLKAENASAETSAAAVPAETAATNAVAAEAAQSDKEAQNRQNSDKATAEIRERLSPVADQVRAAYENAVAWYLAGLFLEKEGDRSNAAIAYGEASRINPAVGACVKPPAGGTDITLVFEEGLIDLKEPVKIPLPFGGTVWSIDFPVYSAPAAVPSQLAVELQGRQVAACVPAVNVQALAYRDLRDRIPGIATRNVTRAAVKIAAQQVANHARTGNSYGDLALQLGVLAYNATSTVISEADTRCWQTLPEHVHLARFSVPQGVKSFTLRNARTGQAMEIPVGTGASRLVWISDMFTKAVFFDVPVGCPGTPVQAAVASVLTPPVAVPAAVVVQPAAVQTIPPGSY